MICDRFIHVHIPRTGGSLVRSLVEELLVAPGRLSLVDDDAHPRLSLAREVCPDAPAFTFVRNPWDWYTSRWSRDVEIGRCDTIFGDYLESCISLTWWWEYLGCEDVDCIGRYERLSVEVERIFHILVPDLVSHEEVWAAIARIGPVRATSWRVPYPFYYYRGRSMVDLVYQKDKELIQRFGYEFPGEETVSFPHGLATGKLLGLLQRSLGL